MAGVPTERAALDRVIARNTKVLAGCMTLSWATVQLALTAGAPMLAELSGEASIAGFAPAIYVAWWAIASLLMGRYMDARGRAAGIRLGFAGGAAGCLAVYVAATQESLVLFLIGVALAGGGAGVVHLARTGGADMQPPERRARGISSVVIGAAFGAILGPIAFIPLLARSGSDLDVLAPPFIVATIVMLAGVVLTFAIRVDPLDIARAAGRAREVPAQRRPTRGLLRIPLVRAAIIAALIAQLVMTSMMSVVSLLLKDHGHGWAAVSASLSAHFLGMFGLILVIGKIVDRVGQKRAILLGYVVLIGGVLAMLVEVQPHWIAPAMFAIGIGWNLGFVAATAMIADSTDPSERAGLIGLVDFIALMGGAAAAIGAGYVLDKAGLGMLVAFGVTLCALPLVIFVLHRHPRQAPAEA